MKIQLASLELHYIVEELQALVGGRVDQIYNPKKEELVLQLHISGKGKQILRIISGKLIYLASSREEASEPSQFCMFLRKHLGGARLIKIRQLESERIAELAFERKDGNKKLILELFGKGNIIICDEDYVILSAIVYQKWKDREIRARLKYSYPRTDYGFLDIKLSGLRELFSKTEKNLVKCLATELGFGGIYSEEICLLSGIGKDSDPSDLDENSIEKILKTLKIIINNKINPLIIYEDNNIKDVVPFELKIYGNFKNKRFKSYNGAFDYYFLNEFKEEKPKSKQEKEIERLQRIIERQEEKIQELSDLEAWERRKGELIYQNYKLVEDILREIKKATAKYSWSEIKEKLEGHKIIKSVNSKDKTIDIEI